MQGPAAFLRSQQGDWTRAKTIKYFLSKLVRTVTHNGIIWRSNYEYSHMKQVYSESSLETLKNLEHFNFFCEKLYIMRAINYSS